MNYRFFTVLFLLWLSGCSGGITGTGDGGTVTPIDIAPADSNDNLPSVVDSPLSSFVSVPSQILLDLPPTLQAELTASQSGTVDLNSPGTRLREGITLSQLDTIAILIDLFLIDQLLDTGSATNVDAIANNEASCTTGSTCNLLVPQLTVTVDVDGAAAASDLLAPFTASSLTTSSINANANLQPGNTLTYSNISVQSGLTGFFDNRLQYSREDGSTVTLQWSDDQQWVSVLAQNIDSTLYSLLQSSEMTLRRTDHLQGDASIQLIAIQGTAPLESDSTFIEADLNDDNPVFIRAIGNASASAIFAESLLIDDMLYREATNSQGQVTNLETCMNVCSQWQTLQSTQTLPDNFFDNNASLATTVSGSIVSPIDASFLPQQVNEFVVTIGDANTGLTTTPTDQTDNLVCGGQRLGDGIRTFCWQPTPLGSTGFVFEENRVDSSTTYRFVTQRDDL